MYAAREKESTGGLKSLPAREKKLCTAPARSRSGGLKPSHAARKKADTPATRMCFWRLRNVVRRAEENRRALAQRSCFRCANAHASKRELRCVKPRTRVSGKHARACATFARERESPEAGAKGQPFRREPKPRRTQRVRYFVTQSTALVTTPCTFGAASSPHPPRSEARGGVGFGGAFFRGWNIVVGALPSRSCPRVHASESGFSKMRT